MKHQNSSTQSQINSKDGNFKFETTSLASLRIGACNLFGAWNLGFGIRDATYKSNAKIIPFSLMLLMLLVLQVAGCAKKGPPVPWDSIVPKRIVDLVATPRDGRLLLEWTIPKENTDKTPLTNLAEFKILRSEGVLIGEECKGCGEKPKVVHEIKLAKENIALGKRTSIFFEDQEPRKVYVYEVVSVNRRRDPSAPSNPVTVYWDHPPQAPGMVTTELGDKKVGLSWNPVDGAAGYNIYRRTDPEEGFSVNPLNRELLKATQYTDLNVRNDIKYVYSVRAVKRVVKTDVEGKGSSGVPATPTKLTPPSIPVGLVAIPLKEGMELNWRRNAEPDLLGYYVYRRKPGEEEFKRLNESPVTKEAYLDTDVVSEQEYEYTVTAVDNSPRRNESPRSEEVRVKYLY
jgi:fibronectin type 3 domain-containing protein